MPPFGLRPIQSREISIATPPAKRARVFALPSEMAIAAMSMPHAGGAPGEIWQRDPEDDRRRQGALKDVGKATAAALEKINAFIAELELLDLSVSIDTLAANSDTVLVVVCGFEPPAGPRDDAGVPLAG